MDESFALYQLLTKADENDAVCRFRLGQALRRRGSFAEARDALNEAADILERGKDPRVDKHHWIRGAVYVELGNAEWHLFGSTVDQKERQSAIRSAVVTAKRGAEIYKTVNVEEDMKLGALNNLLYFGWEERKAYGDGLLSDDEMSDILGELRIDRVKSLVHTNKLDKVLDTIEKIYQWLGRNKEAADVAVSIVDLMHARVKRRARSGDDPNREMMQLHLSADELDTYWFALETVAKFAMRGSG
jgi:hypothetical protein